MIEVRILSGMVIILSIAVIYLGYALIKEQIKSRKYLSNFLELWKEKYVEATKEIEERRNDALRRNEI